MQQFHIVRHVIKQYNDTEILDNNVKQLIKDFKIIEEE